MPLKGIIAALFLFESSIISGVIIAFQLRTPPLTVSPEGLPLALGPLTENETYVFNYFTKIKQNAIFLSDVFGKMSVPVSLAAAVLACGLLIMLTFLWREKAENPSETNHG